LVGAGLFFEKICQNVELAAIPSFERGYCPTLNKTQFPRFLVLTFKWFIWKRGQQEKNPSEAEIPSKFVIEQISELSGMEL
jgi:hypothetical protein